MERQGRVGGSRAKPCACVAAQEENEGRGRWDRAKAALGGRTRGIEGMGSPGARLGLDGPGGRPSGEGAGWALEGCGPASLLSLSLFL